MKFAVAVILIAFEASSIVMPGNIPVASTSNLKNLERVKRCFSDTAPCRLVTKNESSLEAVVADDQPEDVIRSKRSVCFCTEEGCGCTLIEQTEKESLVRLKRNSNNDVLSASGQPKELNRKKRQSCACGRHGCFCDDLDNLGDQFVQVSNSYSSSASSSSSTSSSSSFTYYG